MQETIKLENGKYEWRLHDNYSSDILRHGELWKDTTGDNFILAAMQEIVNLREELDKIYEVLEQLPVDVEELLHG